MTSLDMVPGDRFAFSGGAEIIAHRGYSGRAPENTLAAIDAAAAAGADAVEFDLHVTADGVPVLFHDDTLQRTTDGAGRVANHTLPELAALDAGSWFGPEFAGEVVPTFASALERGAGRVARFYPEIKGYRSPADLETMLTSVIERGMLEHTVFISMDWEALAHLKSIHAGVGVGYIIEKASRARDAMALATGDPNALLDFDAKILLGDPALAREATRQAIPLAVWTVDDPVAATRLHALGIPRITTNRVSDLVAWKKSL